MDKWIKIIIKSYSSPETLERLPRINNKMNLFCVHGFSTSLVYFSKKTENMYNKNYLFVFFIVILLTITSTSLYLSNNNSNINLINGIDKIRSEQVSLKHTVNVLTKHIKDIKDTNTQINIGSTTTLSDSFVQVMKDKLYNQEYTEEQSAEVGSLLLNSVLFQDGQCDSYKVLGGGSDNGVPGEGSWKICQDSDKWHVNRSNQCQVFSFGIANDFTFDDELTKLGCKVESFDPSMSMESQKRSDLNNFWKIGIADKDTNDFEGKEYGGSRKQVWEVYTLETLMKRFKVEYLDFLKMDIEGNEWPILKQWIESGILKKIKMLTFEVHFWSSTHDIHTHLEWAKIIIALREQGFKLFGTRENPMSTDEDLGFLKKSSCCYDLYWYNSNI
ncbi:hypothetical protein PPL_06359 [Heterostelium album PN500]|uniref:Methyltransferase domain-containing protein n=1 Tax=Heterostelium pallidum (strain ATCC 26659 / Pp 5 / PN500) TaxID=670386 RepID=D3BCY1_HETP5|nr:hypothetical protein PPL_06359 [Heterostelium album PN500]EFA80773.1 hypothetical protein PPL_06359 [Heterostelium album PN500]|eukprot:XP_020432892.1 hypothetical protein PPL_06359 [Heterostelium album PN500]